MGELTGKAALVTGGESGIGRAVALAYAREGAKVLVVDLHPSKTESTVQAITKAGGEAHFIQVDVSKAAECERMVQEGIKKFGRLDIACNNAGIGGEVGPTADYSVEGWAKVIGVNLSGVFYCLKYELPELLKSKGVAVNMASILGQVGFAGSPAYVAAKHGVVGLTQTAAVEYAAKGVRINAVGPGFIKTPLIDPMLEDKAVNDLLVSLHPMGRLGESDEVAEMVLWLSSSKASFVTGTYFAVDGGYLAR